MTVEVLATVQRLSAGERDELEQATSALVRQLRWEAARGFTLTDEIRQTIAAHAALLTLRLDRRLYSHVSSVVVHAGPIRVQGPHRGPGGLGFDGDRVLDGQAEYHGPVVINWAALRRELLRPAYGTNVALHEFAHAIDHADGLADGTPPLESQQSRQRWRDLCEPEYHRMVASRRPDPVVRSYATTNPAEFFAVVTETFFLQPERLDRHKPALYRLFADFYGQDPLARTAA